MTGVAKIPTSKLSSEYRMSSKWSVLNRMRLDTASTAATLRQSPWLSTDDLALAVGPEVDGHADDVVDGGVGALVQENGGQRCQGDDGEAGFQTAVDGRASNEAQGPLPCEHEETQDQVDNLQYRNGLANGVKVAGQEVPEYLGPEEALDGGNHLVCVLLVQCVMNKSYISSSG